MNIRFADKKFGKQCNSQRDLVRAFGPQMAERIRQRLDEMDAAATLEDLRPPMPGRYHELTGNLAGYISADLFRQQRLLLLPDHDPVPANEDGGLDWKQVTAVLIVEIRDTHE